MNFTWHPLAGPRALDVTVRLEREFIAWRGTPHVAGQAVRGVGVDCVRFITAVLDAAFGRPRTLTPRMPQDLAWHDARGAMRVAEAIIAMYPVVTGVDPGGVEPGDIILVRMGAGPGHVLMVGPQPWTAWHAPRNSGVCRTGLGAVSAVLRIWRVEGKDQWFQS